MRSPFALLVAALVGLAACDQTVVAPPTDHLHNAAPPQIGFNPVPGNTPSEDDQPSSHSTSPVPDPIDSTDPTDEKQVSSAPAGNVAPEFYDLAAAVATPGPMGPSVATDSRPAAQIAAARATHPELTPFQTTTPSPPPDWRAPFEPLVDAPAEPAPEELDPLTIPFDADLVTGAGFSDPAVANIVIASRAETSGGQWQTRLWRFDLKTGELLAKALLPDQARLLDVSADGTRALVRLTGGLEPTRRPASSQTRLDIWDLSQEAGQHLIGWKPGAGEEGAAAPVLDAAFVGKELVLTLVDGGALTLWDTAQHAALRSVHTASNGPLVLTPGRSGVFVFRGSTFALFEADTLEYRGALAAPRPTLAYCPAAACSADGTRLVAIFQRPAQELLVWDLASGECSDNFPARLDLAGSPHFVSPGYVMVGGTLFDLKKQAPVWLFVENAKNHNLDASLGLRHWLVFRPALGDAVVQGVDVPNEELQSFLNGPAPQIQPAFRPGDSMAVTLALEGLPDEDDPFREKLARALGRMCDDHGLALQNNADFVLEIRATDRKTGESIRFNSDGSGGGQIVPAHEIALSFTLTRRNEQTPLWTGSGRVPPVFVFEESRGLSLEQSLVRTMWQSAAAKIGRLLNETLPVHIPKIPLTEQIGQTRLWAGLDDHRPPNRPSSASPGGEDSEAGALAELDLPHQQPSLMFTVAKAPIRDAALSRDGRLAVTSDDDRFRLWLPLPRRRKIHPLNEVKVRASPTRVCLDANGEDFLFGTADGQVRHVDVSREYIKVIRDSLGGAVTGLVVTSAATIVAGTDAGAVLAWRDRNEEAARTLAERPAPITDLAAVPNTNRVVAAWADGTTLLLDAGTAKTVRGFNLDAGTVRDVSISDNAEYAAFATEQGAIVVSVFQGEEVARIDCPRLWSVAFRPHTSELAIGTAAGRVFLWNITDPKPMRRFDGAGGRVQEIIFSYDGRGFAAVIAGLRTTPFWSIEGGSER